MREQPLAGRHNCKRGPERESERPIVAKKRGNARGAKGPYWKQASIEMRREPLERKAFHYGRTGSEPRKKKGKDTGETLSSEGEAGPKGQARAEVPVLHTV